jgi:hypothetical protein
MFIVPWQPELVYTFEFREALSARRSIIFADFHNALTAILERHDSAESARVEIDALEEYTRGRLDTAWELLERRFPRIWIEPGRLPC